MYFIKLINRKLHSFFTVPQSPAPLALLRILIALFVLLQAALWYPDWLAFFGPDGWLQWEISQALAPYLSIHISAVVKFFAWFGLDSEQAVMLFFWVYVIGALGLLLGIFTRFWAVLTWFCHYVLMCSMDAYMYGVDIFVQISLFYMMLMPVAKRFSLDARLKRINTGTSWRVTLSLRVLQLHLCLAYLSAGYEKMLSKDWWNGNVLWRAVVQPDFNQFNLTWLSHEPWLPMLLSWFTMIVETGYIVAMWIPRLRACWLLAIIMLHAGIAVFLGLWMFGLVMILLSVSAFGYDVWADIAVKRPRFSYRPVSL